MRLFHRWRERRRALARIEQLLVELKGIIMSSEQNLEDKLTAIDAGVSSLGAEVADLKALVNALPAGQIVTQDQLDAMNAKADGILSKIAAIPPATDAPTSQGDGASV